MSLDSINLITVLAIPLILIIFVLFIKLKSKIVGFNNFEKNFLNSEGKFIVFKPQTNSPEFDKEYPFFNLSDYDEFNFDKNKMENLIRGTNNICQICNKNMSSIAYFDSGHMKYFNDHNEWLIPDSSPLIICKSCTLNKIKPILTSSKIKDFQKPNGSGIYISVSKGVK